MRPIRAAARQIVSAAIDDGRQWLDPVEIKNLLEAYEIPMVPTFAADDVDQAVAYAEALFAQGATVVLKIMSRDIVHKSDVGGVVLNLTNADAVRSAAADILARAKKLRPEARISGVIVQAMVVRQKARELILGLADDPTFGTVVVFGRGGTAVELINDKALALPPLDLPLACDLIERTRVSRLLRGYRDVPAVKQDAVAMVLVKLAQMAAEIPEIRELDINPLLADEAGVLAVDARVAVGRSSRKFSGLGTTNFAVRPYPSRWERHIEVKDGWRVFVRPIRPEDEPAIHELLRHVTPEDLRLRFFAPMKEFTHQFIARLTQLDYARAMAFVAFDEASNELVGVVRIHSDSIYESGEYAILLRSDLKGRGLGWALMQLSSSTGCELGGTAAAISPDIRERLDASLPPTWSGSNPVDIVGDADPARYAVALEALLDDPGNDAILVMNVQTAIASAADIAATVTELIRNYRQRHRGRAKPVLAVWVGADPKVRDILSGAGIPNYPTEGDAVRGFMHLVRHREVVETLAQVPPAMPSEFAPDIRCRAKNCLCCDRRRPPVARSGRDQEPARGLRDSDGPDLCGR